MFEIPPHLRVAFQDHRRKSVWRVLSEAVRLALTRGAPPIHYFTRFLYRRGAGDISTYLTNREVEALLVGLNDEECVPFLRDKLLFERHFGRWVRTPNVVGYNVGQILMTRKGRRRVGGPNELLSALRGSCTKERIFVKPQRGEWGEGTFLVDLNRDCLVAESIYQKMSATNFIFQSVVEQHEAMAAVYPDCVNTVRIDTWMDEGGQCSLLAGIARFGTGGHHVDNGSSGGLFAALDLESGRLGSRAWRYLKCGAEVFAAHPDTRIVFEQVRVPYIDKVCKLVTRAAELVPSVALVGWDIAIGREGPVLLEGNADYHIGMMEIANGGYLANDAFRDGPWRVFQNGVASGREG